MSATHFASDRECVCNSQTNVMVFLMHSEQGPPCISALSHFTRRNRHESQALRDGRIVLVPAKARTSYALSDKGQSRRDRPCLSGS